MNFPGPVEFTWLIFLSLFFSWFRAVVGVAAAVFIRNRWLGIAVAAVAGIGEIAVDMGIGPFFSGLLDQYNFIFVGLAALAGLAWWGIGRALYTMVTFGYRRLA